MAYSDDCYLLLSKPISSDSSDLLIRTLGKITICLLTSSPQLVNNPPRPPENQRTSDRIALFTGMARHRPWHRRCGAESCGRHPGWRRRFQASRCDVLGMDAPLVQCLPKCSCCATCVTCVLFPRLGLVRCG